jgi:hypothetical protein
LFGNAPFGENPTRHGLSRLKCSIANDAAISSGSPSSSSAEPCNSRGEPRERRLNPLREGRITSPIMSAAEADAQWAKNTGRERRNGGTPVVDASLAEARRRRLRATIEPLAAEVEHLREATVTLVEVQRTLREGLAPVFARFRLIAELVQSLEPDEIKREVAAALTDVSSDDDGPPAILQRPRPAAVHGAANATELDTRKTSLLAERAEFNNALRAGAIVWVADVGRDLEYRLTAGRATLLNLKDRLYLSKAELAADVEAAIAEIAAQPAPIEVPAGELPPPARYEPVTRSPSAKPPPKPKPAKPERPPPAGVSLAQLTAEYNALVPEALRLGVRAFVHKSLFGDRAGANKQISKLRASIQEMGMEQCPGR